MHRILRSSVIALALLGIAPRAPAQIEPYIGQIIAVGFNFCPQGWFTADGSLVPIQTYSALFSLIGTIYGGDGVTTFALPDLRGRVPVGEGTGPGLSPRQLGEGGGVEEVTLTQTQMPQHIHLHAASTGAANTPNPAAALPARKLRTPMYRGGSPPDTSFDSSAIQPAGGGQPHENMPPFTTLRWCIAAEGVYPSRP